MSSAGGLLSYGYKDDCKGYRIGVAVLKIIEKNDLLMTILPKPIIGIALKYHDK